MTQALESPQGAPQPSGRPAWVLWLAGLLLAVMVPTAAYAGWLWGLKKSPVSLLDPLWIRVYTDRPLDTAGPGDGFWVAGYYVDYDRSSLEMVKRTAGHMDQIVLFGYGFDRQGNPQGQDQEIIRGITGAQKRLLLFGNLTNGAFDKETAHAILTEKAVQDRAIQGMLAKTQQLGVAGVQIDFENIPLEDRDAYTAFLKRLKTELAAQKLTLTVAVAAKTRDTRTGWGGATDYAAIGQIADQLYIMTYDEHWRGGEPGPVASLGWTEKVIRYATGVMPAQKIILGVPFYGYEWSADPGGDGKTNRAYGARAMAKRVQDLNGKVTWDPVAGENVATFKAPEGERIAWYPDQRSLDAKLKLAYQYNLKGVSLWRLGFEPDDWWHGLGAFRLSPQK